MAPFKKDLTPLSKKGSVTVHKGKGASQERLPSRGAVNTLVGSDTAPRSMNNYAKETPNLTQAAAPPGLPNAGPQF
jgi:hypothetical protein